MIPKGWRTVYLYPAQSCGDHLLSSWRNRKYFKVINVSATVLSPPIMLTVKGESLPFLPSDWYRNYIRSREMREGRRAE